MSLLMDILLTILATFLYGALSVFGLLLMVVFITLFPWKWESVMGMICSIIEGDWKEAHYYWNVFWGKAKLIK